MTTAEGAGVAEGADPALHGPSVHGPPDAPAIVFVHGTRLTGSMWVAQQLALAGTYRTIALDLPGHGRRADTPFTLEGAADVVAETITTHAPGGRAVVVGLSLGGYVAMALAAREPERVRGLVLSGATAEPVGLRSVPYSAFAGAMTTGRWPAARGSQCVVLPDPLSGGHRRADHRRRVLVGRRRRGPARHRR